MAALVAAVAVVGCQPEDETPGLWLGGEIFIETRPWYGIPHSTTIWCVELGGKLYIGSYGEEKKTWEKNVARRPAAKLAISGKLHEVTVVPVSEPNRIEALDAAYAKKYDMAEVFGDEIPEWWYYQVVTRP